MGQVLLENDRIVFVFPEHPDDDGNPRRVTLDEAQETEILVKRVDRSRRVALEWKQQQSSNQSP